MTMTMTRTDYETFIETKSARVEDAGIEVGELNPLLFPFQQDLPARSEKDERHIAPLQLGTIERCVRLWTNPGELVLSPFTGIGSEGVVSIRHGRRFVGIELKPEYFEVAVRNLEAERMQGQMELGL